MHRSNPFDVNKCAEIRFDNIGKLKYAKCAYRRFDCSAAVRAKP